jgi:hypothetical protein
MQKARCMPNFGLAGQAFDLHELSGQTAFSRCPGKM